MSALVRFVTEHRSLLVERFAQALCGLPRGLYAARGGSCAHLDALLEGLLRTLEDGRVPAPARAQARVRPEARHAAEALLRTRLFDVLTEHGCAPSPAELSLACGWLARWTEDGLCAVAPEARTGDVNVVAGLKRAAAGSVRLERQLIGIVSHDLRSPLGAVLCGARLALAYEDLPSDLRRTLGRVARSAERAARLVSDLLDVTWARDAHCLPLTPRPLDLHALATQVVEELRLSRPDRELRLRCDGSADGQWDADRLAQLLTNLTCNALEYSPHESAVDILTRGAGDAVELEVHNAGAPIPPEMLERLRAPLAPGALRPCGARGHLGLGLFIARLVVEGHGGTLEVHSSAEAGTTFRARLPRWPPAAAAPVAPQCGCPAPAPAR